MFVTWSKFVIVTGISFCSCYISEIKYGVKLYYYHNQTFVMGSVLLSCLLKFPNVFNNVQTREIHKVNVPFMQEY